MSKSLSKNINPEFINQKTRKLAYIYLAIFAPFQTVLAIFSNKRLFFGEWYFVINIILQLALIILPILWYFLVDKKEFKPRMPKREELKISLIFGSIFATIIFAVYYFIFKPNLHFDTANYSYFSKEVFIIFALFISFFNAFSEEFNYRFMIFGQLKNLSLSKQKASFLTGLIFSVHHIFLVVPLAGISLGLWLGILTLVILTIVSCIWSFLYQKYNSLYPTYFIHIMADLDLFMVGFDALFL